jgi:hypothetical protein
LIKTIEQHQCIGALAVGPPGEPREVREERAELDRHRYLQLRFDSCENA